MASVIFNALHWSYMRMKQVKKGKKLWKWRGKLYHAYTEDFDSHLKYMTRSDGHSNMWATETEILATSEASKNVMFLFWKNDAQAKDGKNLHLTRSVTMPKEGSLLWTQQTTIIWLQMKREWVYVLSSQREDKMLFWIARNLKNFTQWTEEWSGDCG